MRQTAPCQPYSLLIKPYSVPACNPSQLYSTSAKETITHITVDQHNFLNNV